MKSQRKTFFILLTVLVTVACNPARKLSHDQFLLNKNTVTVDNPAISKEDLKLLIKQKPNRKIFGMFRFHLWFYNLVNKERTEKKKAAWIQKTEKENEIRRAKGKKEISTDKLIFREKLLNIGEEPAILDTVLTDRTKKQFQLYLFRKGFFNATVHDTTIYRKNHQANVSYTIETHEPYIIRNITCTSRDSVLQSLINNSGPNSLLRGAARYDEDVIEKERERMANELRNSGYYFFNKNYITIEVDSALGTRETDLFLYVNRVNENADHTAKADALPENHQPYFLRNIYIQPDFNPKDPSVIPADTLRFRDYIFLNKPGRQPFRQEAILRAIFFRKGDLFKQKDLDYSYTRLLDLKVFKFIKIIYNEVPRDSSQLNYLLDVSIQLTPIPKQDYTIETGATHAGGNLGLAGSFGYRNKNTFKGAEAFEFRVKGAVEALRNFNDSLAAKKLFFFNTFEIGPEVNMNIKKFLLPNFITRKTSRYANPRTNFSVSFNYQDRPDYNRRIWNGSFGYAWSESITKSWSWYLADVNSVRVNLSGPFSDKLSKSLDLNLLNSYRTHLTPAGRITFVYTNQSLRPNRSFIFFRGNFETAGNIVAPIVSAIMNEPRTSDGKRTITRIPYAQYIKPDIDVSYHQRLNQHNTLVYRIAIGYGIEGTNSSSLPFEKSFFGGGANSLRAWQARTLGPGSYKNEINIEQSGDVKFEANVEVRSSIFKVLEGAAFIDVGNIWTRHEDAARPGAQFIPENFTNELAVGAGLGLRFDFSFFILRVDGAVKFHDPSLDLNDRWVYSKQKFMLRDITPNLAIGYPF
ncbi:MAG: BamA/TamA family outer membrane protein [Bacteroidetes bacterium]|nr:BamA/TamA family outer membrane protein [Bacteroidota bacterium]